MDDVHVMANEYKNIPRDERCENYMQCENTSCKYFVAQQGICPPLKFDEKIHLDLGFIKFNQNFYWKGSMTYKNINEMMIFIQDKNGTKWMHMI